MLTGEYAWRKKGTGVLPGNANLIIAPGRVTIWLPCSSSKATPPAWWASGISVWAKNEVDWNKEIKPGPREIGFDYSFLIPATGDRVPCVFVENQRVANLDPKDPITVSYSDPIPGEPNGKDNPELLTKLKPSHGHDQAIVNGVSRIGYMKGGKAALWTDEKIADVITGKATSFIERNKAKRFFLYFATHDIHVPRMPNPRFVGKTSMGARGDAIAELDWSVGEVLACLARNGLDKNTLVIFSSDNGPVVDDGYRDQAAREARQPQARGPAARWQVQQLRWRHPRTLSSFAGRGASKRIRFQTRW